jgi:hypothetical protein
LPGWSWDPFSDQWEEGFSHLKAFSEHVGHCRVPSNYSFDDGYKFGQWIQVQRTNMSTMDPDRRQRLEVLPGWSWDPLAEQWEDGFAHLKQFSEREGHCQVPVTFKTDKGYRLGVWVAGQRDNRDEMDPERRQRLEALRGWVWNILDDKWEQGYACLKIFSERHGHCRVPQKFKTEDGYWLGQWVGVQRRAKDTMKLERRQRLEVLPGWVWDAFSNKWEEGFSHLKGFSEREGHCRVPAKFKTEDGYWLGQWVGVQRRAKDTMGPDRRQRLEALRGWSWDVLSDQWEEGFSRLKQFSEREGHSRVPYDYRFDDGYGFGQWISVQKRNKDTMGPDRRQRLEALPGWVWKVEK